MPLQPYHKFKNSKGIEFEILFRKPDKRNGECDGVCYKEDDDSKGKIFIRPGMSAKRELNTIIHEILHAFYWDKSEYDVDRCASVISNYLSKSGWRKLGKQNFPKKK